MTAAELLRLLDREATWGRWKHYAADGHREVRSNIEVVARVEGLEMAGDTANARLITTLRNLLPEIAALVEAVDAWAQVPSKPSNAMVSALVKASRALNAKAREVAR